MVKRVVNANITRFFHRQGLLNPGHRCLHQVSHELLTLFHPYYQMLNVQQKLKNSLCGADDLKQEYEGLSAELSATKVIVILTQLVACMCTFYWAINQEPFPRFSM